MATPASSCASRRTGGSTPSTATGATPCATSRSRSCRWTATSDFPARHGGNTPCMATTVTERESREVAEAARESEWKLPSFGKQLFLGNFCLDLIHPQPSLDKAAVEKGERFLADLKAFLASEVDPQEI